ncbi:MAG: hypothetical protein ACE5F9_13585 [Phycisphaerae bacterium]
MSLLTPCSRIRQPAGCRAVICLLVGLVGGVLPVSHAEGQIRGRVIRVGLFAGANPIVREGEWSFVEVELRYTGVKPFDGELRVEQRERDGDVVLSPLPVALAPNGNPRSYAVYFVPHDMGGGGAVSIRLFDASGKLVSVTDDTGQEQSALISFAVNTITPDAFLIVDLSPRKLPHVAGLDSSGAGPASDEINSRRVRAMAPRELPARWQGLAPVDAIVWDDADPGALSDQQIEALLDWVRQGGRLLLTSGSNWQTLAKSPLARVLPVTINGVSESSEALAFEDIVGQSLVDKLGLARQYFRNPITLCRIRSLPSALPIPRRCPNEQIAYRRMLGRGVITFVGASLHELLPAPRRLGPEDRSGLPPATEPFSQACERVVARNFLLLPQVREPVQAMFQTRPDLFRLVRQSIGFEEIGAAFLIFAIVFACAYTLIATAGSYWYLKRKSLQHHCWTAFALVGVAGSLIGTAMVWTLRGVSRKVWQTTIIDSYAGRDDGYATCLFGLKTPNHTRLRLDLPVGDATGPSAAHGSLQPMPETLSFDAPRSRFVASERYRCLWAGETLDDVPLRATLKEFLGRTHGPIGGTLDAKLTFRRIRDEAGNRVLDVSDDSFLRNGLVVDLHDCFLIETEREGDQRGRAGGVRCYYLGVLAAKGDGLDAAALRGKMFLKPPDRLHPNAPPERKPEIDLTIGKWLRRWQVGAVKPVSADRLRLGTRDLPREKLTAEQHEFALLLLSAFDLMEDSGKVGSTAIRLLRTHGRPLGCMHQLTPGTAILIGYSNQPSPMTLNVDERPLRPSKALTLYRFVIPVERR